MNIDKITNYIKYEETLQYLNQESLDDFEVYSHDFNSLKGNLFYILNTKTNNGYLFKMTCSFEGVTVGEKMQKDYFIYGVERLNKTKLLIKYAYRDLPTLTSDNEFSLYDKISFLKKVNELNIRVV